MGTEWEDGEDDENGGREGGSQPFGLKQLMPVDPTPCQRMTGKKICATIALKR